MAEITSLGSAKAIGSAALAPSFVHRSGIHVGT
jgi:hypothetical protein